MLKIYQREAIERLDTFCNDIQSKPITQSFKDITSNQYLEVDDFSNPYVCVRIPTGGGKTFIASKSIRILVNEYLQKDYHVVLWLAPSDKIVTQTLEALKDKRHFYRKVLDKEFDNINVMSIKESYKQKFDPINELVIIVGTIQSFRTNSKDMRKFYEENSNYYELLKDRDVVPSLKSVMEHFKPIIILDEAHKSGSALSVESLLQLDPSFILELTATPTMKTQRAKKIYASNILYSVSATALKKENMIKLPILLKTLDDSMAILKDGVEKRIDLEEITKIEYLNTDKYIRPINLIRADENRGDDSLTYDKIKTILIEDFKIDESHIAIQTGNKKEIDGIDLLSPKCEIRYIITVDALKEGWDCPFAYVLSVVSNMNSETAIEQLIGRVLRMPYIEKKYKKELGYSYVFVASNSFEKVAENIGQTLVKSGFEKMEAEISISNAVNTNENVLNTGLWAEILYKESQIEIKEDIKIEDFSKKSIDPYIDINTQTNKISIIGLPTKSKRPQFKKDLKKAMPEIYHKELDAILEKMEDFSSDKDGIISDIELPKLMIEDDGEIREFEESIIFDYIEIDDKDLLKNAILTESEFNIELNEHLGIIDIENDKLRKREVTAEQQSLFDIQENEDVKKVLNEHIMNSENKETIAKLSVSIAKIVVDENRDILRVLESRQLNTFISLVILSLLEKRKDIDIFILKSKKYLLKKAILNKLNKIVLESKKLSFKNLFDSNRFSFDNNSCFVFSPSGTYNPNPDKRSEEFKKHKYPKVHKFDSQEEYKVAKYIDSMENVITWVRNIDCDYNNSFRLLTSTGNFYPDFIIHFNNGITAVAEYKGAVYIPEYEKNKKPIGDAWGMQDEKYRFLSLYNDNFEDELKKIIK